MRTLQIKQDSLLVAFRNAGKEGKQVLSDLFGKQVALYDNITDRVKSFEDACQVLGISTNVPEVKGLPRKHQKAIIANYKLIVIAEALNEGWKPNWQDSDEYKYYLGSTCPTLRVSATRIRIIRRRLRVRLSVLGFA